MDPQSIYDLYFEFDPYFDIWVWGWPWRVLGARHTGDCHNCWAHQTPGCWLQAGTETPPCRDQEHPQNRGNVAKPLPRPWPAHLRTEKHDLISSQSGLGSPEMRWYSRICLSSETMTKIRSHFRWFLIFFIFFGPHTPQPHRNHLWLHFSRFDHAIFWAWAELCA